MNVSLRYVIRLVTTGGIDTNCNPQQAGAVKPSVFSPNLAAGYNTNFAIRKFRSPKFLF